jgi:hypothetical protein
MPDLTDFQNFVTVMDGNTTYKGWARKNGGDATRWQNYSSEILAGQTPAPPAMSTAFGKSLVIVGIIALKASDSVSDGYGEGYYGTADFRE